MSFFSCSLACYVGRPPVGRDCQIVPTLTYRLSNFCLKIQPFSKSSTHTHNTQLYAYVIFSIVNIFSHFPYPFFQRHWLFQTSSNGSLTFLFRVVRVYFSSDRRCSREGFISLKKLCLVLNKRKRRINPYMRTQDEAILCSNASLPICQIICVMVGHSSNREVYGVFRLRRTQPS